MITVDDLDELELGSFGIAYEHYTPGDYLGLEIEAFTGGSDSDSAGGIGVSVDVDYYVTAKLNAGIPIDNHFFYVSVGGGYIGATASGCAFGFCATEDADGSGVIAGVGANF